MGDYHVDRPQVEAPQGVKPSGTNRPFGLPIGLIEKEIPRHLKAGAKSTVAHSEISELGKAI